MASAVWWRRAGLLIVVKVDGFFAFYYETACR